MYSILTILTILTVVIRINIPSGQGRATFRPEMPLSWPIVNLLCPNIQSHNHGRHHHHHHRYDYDSWLSSWIKRHQKLLLASATNEQAIILGNVSNIDISSDILSSLISWKIWNVWEQFICKNASPDYFHGTLMVYFHGTFSTLWRCLKQPFQCLTGTLWDTPLWSPRTLPVFPHFNTSLTNELMDFCRSIWWICAGGSPDFLTDCCPELVSTDGIHETKSRDSHQSSISGCSDIWSLVFTWSIQSMPSFLSKIIAGVIFICTAGTTKNVCVCLMIMTILIGGNQFPIMNTLSYDGSEQGSSGLRNWPNFLRYFQSVAPIWSGGWVGGGQIAHLEPRLKN